MFAPCTARLTSTPQSGKRLLASNVWLVGPGTRLADYPRITYVIAVKLGLSVDLTLRDSDVEAILPACLDRELADSQEVAELWRHYGVQGIRYPSAVPGVSGTNVVVFRDVVPAPEIVPVNRERIIAELRRLSDRSPN